MASLLRAFWAQAVETFLPFTSAKGASIRSVSPTPGRSIWMTSAPKSASMVAANGMATREPEQTTRMPAKGPYSGIINLRSLIILHSF